MKKSTYYAIILIVITIVIVSIILSFLQPKINENTVEEKIIESANKETKIFWKKDIELQWVNFTRIYAVDDSPICANTNHGIEMTTAQGIISEEPCQYQYTEITIRSVFYTQKSWVKEHLIDYCSLEHERKHFDIAEIYSRVLWAKIFEKVNGIVYSCPEHGSGSLWTRIHNETNTLNDKFYNEVFDKFNATQNRYDMETDLGIIDNKQKEWEDRIEYCLEMEPNQLENCLD